MRINPSGNIGLSTAANDQLALVQLETGKHFAQLSILVGEVGFEDRRSMAPFVNFVICPDELGKSAIAIDSRIYRMVGRGSRSKSRFEFKMSDPQTKLQDGGVLYWRKSSLDRFTALGLLAISS